MSGSIVLFRERPGEQKSSARKDQYDADVTKNFADRNQPCFIWRSITGKSPIVGLPL